MSLGPIELTEILVGVLTAALGLLVLRAAPRKPVNQFFALFMVLIAGNAFAEAAFNLSLASADPNLRTLTKRLAFQFLILDPPALLYFAMLFPRRDPRLDNPWVLAVFAVPVVVFTALNLAAPGVIIPQILQDPDLARSPLHRLGWALVPGANVAFYLAGFWVMLRNFLQERSPIFQRHLAGFLVGFGVALVPRAGLFFANESPVLLHEVLGFSAPWVQFLALSAPTLALFGLAAALALGGSTGAERERVRAPFVAMGAMLGVIEGVWAVGTRTLDLGQGIANTTSGANFGIRWLVFGAVVGYALLKYQVFDVELRTKRWVRGAATAAGIGALALLAALGASVAAPGSFVALAVGEALVVGVAAVPMLRGSDRLAGRLFPAARENSDYLYARKVEVYRANLESALADGSIDDFEGGMLEDLRRSLGLSMTEHRLIEHMVRARLAAPAPPEAGGLLLGKYEVVRPLGEGAFGRAVLARDTTLDRTVVIKEMLPLWRGDAGMREAFLAEARIAARLNHAHVVTLHEVERSGDDLFMVMEYCEGGSLEDRLLREGSLPLPEVVRLGAQALEGLEEVHRAGIIHRDVKPSNLLLDRAGKLKVADFGVARVLEQGHATLLHLTATGSQPGTLAYMSPEQVEGREVDARSDLYSLAAVMVRMVTGKHYFDLGRAGDFEARRRILQEPPRIPPGLPPGIRDVLAKALAKQPEDRFAGAAEMRAALLAAALAPPSLPAAGGVRAPSAA